jgi:hypothetical protein
LHDLGYRGDWHLQCLLLHMDESPSALGKYAIRLQVVKVHVNGINAHRLVRIPNAEVNVLDDSHDELVRAIR